MSADIESFAAAQRARLMAQPSPAATLLAERYVRRAEEALQLLAAGPGEDDRRAICQITETWLTLAEASLRPTPLR
jgi:hypothetical protein